MTQDEVMSMASESPTEDLLLQVVMDRLHPQQIYTHVVTAAGRAAFASLANGRFTDVDDAWQKVIDAVVTGIAKTLEALEPEWREVADHIVRDHQPDDEVLNRGYL